MPSSLPDLRSGRACSGAANAAGRHRARAHETRPRTRQRALRARIRRRAACRSPSAPHMSEVPVRRPPDQARTVSPRPGPSRIATPGTQRRCHPRRIEKTACNSTTATTRLTRSMNPVSTGAPPSKRLQHRAFHGWGPVPVAPKCAASGPSHACPHVMPSPLGVFSCGPRRIAHRPQGSPSAWSCAGTSSAGDAPPQRSWAFGAGLSARGGCRRSPGGDAPPDGRAAAWA